MPWSLPTPCGQPGCGALSHDRFCEQHSQIHNKRNEAARRQQADYREQKAKYNSKQWRALRRVVLKEEPLCRICKQQGIISESKHVDHIDSNWTNDKRSNLQGLCVPCHSSKTCREDGGFGNRATAFDTTGG